MPPVAVVATTAASSSWSMPMVITTVAGSPRLLGNVREARALGHNAARASWWRCPGLRGSGMSPSGTGRAKAENAASTKARVAGSSKPVMGLIPSARCRPMFSARSPVIKVRGPNTPAARTRDFAAPTSTCNSSVSNPAVPRASNVVAVPRHSNLVINR